ncbi:MAG: stage III sporulation protein AG [Brotaphodocola sp.]
MWKFKSWKGKDKCLFLLSIGMILCILAFPAENFSKKSERAKPSQGENDDSLQVSAPFKEEDDASVVSAAAQSSYEAILERRVKEVLKHVEGVGNVDVLIVLKSSSEKVIQMDESQSRSVSDEKDSSGGTRRTESEEKEHTTIFTDMNDGRTPVIQKELYPEISGIVISAEGGANPTVSAEISAAMEALFGLPAHKIKVLKRVE